MSSMVLQGIMGLCFGALAASGVLTVLVAVGLVPRYVGRVHEAKRVTLFENMIILGTMGGTLVNLLAGQVRMSSPSILGVVFQIFYGLFAGVFVGTLALAIAEMLDAIPIYFRRMRVSQGLKWILLAVALGKMTGAFVYFYYGIGEQG